MQKLVRKKLVNQLDYDMAGEIGVCKACIGGKQCKNSQRYRDVSTPGACTLRCVWENGSEVHRGSGVLPDTPG